MIAEANASSRHGSAEAALTCPADRPRRPLVVNLLGPSGAGKTSLTNALQSCDPRVLPLPPSSKGTLCYHLLKTCLPLLPPFLSDHRDTRWFTRREMVRLAHVSAQYDAVRRYSHDAVLVITKGALYQLAHLQMFGPSFTRSKAFQQWRSMWHFTWAEAVDVVIFLDAPDEVLLCRVDARNQDVRVKGKLLEEAREVYAIQRQCHQAAADIKCHHFLSIDTSRASISEATEQVLRSIKKAADGARHPQSEPHSDPQVPPLPKPALPHRTPEASPLRLPSGNKRAMLDRR